MTMRTYLLLALLAACGVNQTPQPAPPSTLPACVPNRDGQLTAAELPIALGQTAGYFASPAGVSRTVDLVGKQVGGEQLWDLSQENADDVVVELGPIALGAQWYAASFPSGQFVVDAGSGLDGVYHQDDQALWLDGTASHEAAPAAGKTLVRYATPVAVLRFPLKDGDAYSTTAPLTDAVIAGLPFIGSDQIDVDVSGHGRVDVPYVNFSPALRVRTHLLRKASSGGAMIGRRTTALLYECFGEVVHADSKTDESNADFTSAAGLRRFALGGMP
jgi:hypothetical protein